MLNVVPSTLTSIDLFFTIKGILECVTSKYPSPESSTTRASFPNTDGKISVLPALRCTFVPSLSWSEYSVPSGTTSLFGEAEGTSLSCWKETFPSFVLMIRNPL